VASSEDVIAELLSTF